MKQFTMSMYGSKEELYKAKSEYLEDVCLAQKALLDHWEKESAIFLVQTSTLTKFGKTIDERFE